MKLLSQNSPRAQALQSLKQSRYYAFRSDEILGKAEDAIDGFVGFAMNICHDNEERVVARQGEQLAGKIRRGERYLKRADVNQSAYNNTLADAAVSLEVAVQKSEAPERKKLSRILTEIRTLAKDKAVENEISRVNQDLTKEARSRLSEVQKDAPGVDVHHHGRPIWNIFESSMVSLEETAQLTSDEIAKLDLLIADLEN